MRNNVCRDFIIIGPNYYNYAYSTVRTIKNMGYSVSFLRKKSFIIIVPIYKENFINLGFNL